MFPRRRRKTAVERRAQYSRAHGRVIASLLSSFQNIQQHRGNQLPQLAAALQQLLTSTTTSTTPKPTTSTSTSPPAATPPTRQVRQHRQLRPPCDVHLLRPQTKQLRGLFRRRLHKQHRRVDLHLLQHLHLFGNYQPRQQLLGQQLP